MYRFDVKFAGILKLVPATQFGVDFLTGLQVNAEMLHPELKPLSEDKLHCTLLHQSYPKEWNIGGLRGDKAFKKFFKNNAMFVDLEIDEQIRIVTEGDRTSAYVEVVSYLESHRECILRQAGFNGMLRDPEASRVFHITLANLTGLPGDSVAYVK